MPTERLACVAVQRAVINGLSRNGHPTPDNKHFHSVCGHPVRGGATLAPATAIQAPLVSNARVDVVRESGNGDKHAQREQAKLEGHLRPPDHAKFPEAWSERLRKSTADACDSQAYPKTSKDSSQP